MVEAGEMLCVRLLSAIEWCMRLVVRSVGRRSRRRAEFLVWKVAKRFWGQAVMDRQRTKQTVDVGAGFGGRCGSAGAWGGW